MPYKKGDLVLISDDTRSSTCIILTELFNVESTDDYNFYYTYCLETGLYGVVYESEVVTLLSEDFAPDFEFHSELFNTDFSFYDYLYEHFSYFPSFFPTGSLDED